MRSNLVFKSIFFLIFFINISNSYSEELKFEATSIEIIDKDKIIIANEGVKILLDDETVIEADQMRYAKEKKFLHAHPLVTAFILSRNPSMRLKWYFEYKKWIRIVPRHAYRYLEFRFLNKDRKRLRN